MPKNEGGGGRKVQGENGGRKGRKKEKERIKEKKGRGK